MALLLPLEELAAEPGAHRHVVQLYRDGGFLARSVALWSAASLRKGGGAILVCTSEHAFLAREELRRRGVDADAFERAGRLSVVDAEGLMARFMVDGMPEEGAFLRLASSLVRSVRASCDAPDAPVRAWGEMVNVLVKQGNVRGARALEALWNKVIERESLLLLCSYQLDNLAEETHDGVLESICHGHSRLLPEEDEAAFEHALAVAMRDVLGEEASREVWGTYATRPPISIRMPPAEAVLVGLRASRPAAAALVLARLRTLMAALAPGG